MLDPIQRYKRTTCRLTYLQREQQRVVFAWNKNKNLYPSKLVTVSNLKLYRLCFSTWITKRLVSDKEILRHVAMCMHFPSLASSSAEAVSTQRHYMIENYKRRNRILRDVESVVETRLFLRFRVGFLPLRNLRGRRPFHRCRRLRFFLLRDLFRWRGLELFHVLADDGS